MMQGGGGAVAGEQRRMGRMPVAWMAQVRVLGHGDAVAAQVENVSEGGVALRWVGPVPKDAVVKASFKPNDGQGEIQAYAHFAWKAPGQSAGLRFMGVGEEVEVRLRSLVERWLQRA